MVSYERRLKRSPSLFQGEESYGYKELVEAVKQVSSVPAAICPVKEVWAEYNLSSDAITLFRKVLHIFSVINDARAVCFHECDGDAVCDASRQITTRRTLIFLRPRT